MVSAYLQRLLARTVLIAYTLLIVKPVLPIMMDKMAHTFWAQVHYRTVHMHNGVEHVHYEVKKASEQNQQGNCNSSSNAKQQTETVAHTLVSMADTKFSLTTQAQYLFQLYQCHILFADDIVDYPPPRA